MNAYADHNFLIYCTKNRGWRDVLVDATASGKVTIVLSPWHFYELAESHSQEELLDLAEKISPRWILERSDLQLAEFRCLWNSIWNGTEENLIPILTLGEVAAALHRTNPQRVANITVRDYVRGLTQNSYSLRESLDEACQENRNVRTYAETGKLSKSMYRDIGRRHVARQIARLEGNIKPSAIQARITDLLASQPLSAKIDTFIDRELLESLKAFKVEIEMSLDFYRTPAMLNANRMVDRQHAVVALSYCDYFITDDQELRNRCQRVAAQCPFKPAEMLSSEDFINRIKAL